MMKRTIAVSMIFILILTMGLQAQFGNENVADNIRWTVAHESVSENEVDLRFTATLSPEWHLYGPETDPGGPWPLAVNFDSNDGFKLKGKLTPDKKGNRYLDEDFEVYVTEYDGKVTFSQRIIITSAKDFTVKGSLTGQICKMVCFPFDEPFSFSLKGYTPPDGTVHDDNSISEQYPDSISDDDDNGTSDTLTTSGVLINNEMFDVVDKDPEKQSLFGFFLFTLIAGLLMIFTPCVFPMIPMNIAFFLNYQGGKSKGRLLAFVYGLSIVLIYSILGMVLAIAFGPEGIDNIISHWITNLIFFLIFIVLASSLFGAFELLMPNSWINKADSQANRGGIIGIFFMALTMVLVSFSCVGPVLLYIIVQASQGAFLKPLVGMLGFSIGFSVPFVVLAWFPAVMKKLPQSGGWMNAIKVVFGFIVLAFGLIFLVNIDQAYHLNILPREVFIAIWIVLAILLGLYLLGKIKFSHDSEVKFIGVFRLFLVIVVFSFALYLLPGLFGSDLKGLDTFLPPKKAETTSIYNGGKLVLEKQQLCSQPKYSDFLHFPHGLAGYFDLEEAIACAKEQGKPVFVDITGHKCKNCKKMEKTVWADPAVLKKFNDEFVMVAIYLDDRSKLNDEDIIQDDAGKALTTLGNKNKYIADKYFNAVGSPYYFVIDHEKNILSGPVSYDPDVKNYLRFLDKGIAAFKAAQK